MKSEIKVAIIEDEIIAARHMVALLKECDPQIEVLETLPSLRKALAWLENHLEQLDLIFMDIKLSDGLSFEIFEKIKIEKPVIFTTAFDEYAIRAFKVNSIDYLLKPVSIQDLAAALEKFKNLNTNRPNIDYRLLVRQIQLNTSRYKDRFLVRKGDSLYPISSKEIAYFLADGNFVLLRTMENKSYPVNFSLDTLEELLEPKYFFRVTRKMIVHIQAIKRIDTYFKGRLKLAVEPPVDEAIIISNRKANDFKSWIDG